MNVHYSQPKGFVGRNICYSIEYNNVYYGHIVAGSSTLNLKYRNDFFQISKIDKQSKLQSIVNNTFFHIEKVNNKYPMRNFTSNILINWISIVQQDWFSKYGDIVLGLETLVELPRTGECYRRAGWTEVGQTKGYTCKRIAGKGTDSWSGKRVWDVKNLRPKRIFCKYI
jgi:hypothetical protein